MSDDLFPVLWLCGPPGVGKTTVAWEIYAELTRAGIKASYVEIDQLGMCFPEPASDPGRHRMQAANLGAVMASFRLAGAQCLIVSGVIDSSHGVYFDDIPRAALTVCRLRANADELELRLVGRQGDAELVAEALREADALDASDFADVCVDTSGLPVAEVARLVRERTVTALNPLTAAPQPQTATASTVDGPILWLCGVTGVGKSLVGFGIFLSTMRAGFTAAYVDLDQIAFCPTSPDDPGNHRVKARTLAALWLVFRAAGAECLVIVGPAEDEMAVKAYAEALPAANITVCRLHAGRDELTRRIILRGQGANWAQPGDPLKGRPTAYLLDVADKAAAHSDALERLALGDLRIDTDGRTAEETAAAIVARTGWPAGDPAARSTPW